MEIATTPAIALGVLIFLFGYLTGEKLEWLNGFKAGIETSKAIDREE